MSTAAPLPLPAAGTKVIVVLSSPWMTLPEIRAGVFVGTDLPRSAGAAPSTARVRLNRGNRVESIPVERIFTTDLEPAARAMLKGMLDHQIAKLQRTLRKAKGLDPAVCVIRDDTLPRKPRSGGARTT